MTVTLDAADVFALGPAGAVAAVREALAGGLDPDGDVPRAVVPLAHGQGLLMPSESGGWFGVKVATVAPGNAARGLRRINATYLLHDSATLTPVALLDGVALTTLRTPAVSVAAGLDRLRALAAGGRGLRLVVFGAGPQGRGTSPPYGPMYRWPTSRSSPGAKGPCPAGRAAAWRRPTGERRLRYGARTSSSPRRPRANRCLTGGWCGTARWCWRSAPTNRTRGSSTAR